MNKIYKVMYSKVKQCAVVVSEIAKSHSHNGESSGVRKHAALTAAVLIALGSLSFTTAFVPMTAEAATKTGGSNFVGVERTDGLLDDKEYDNYGGKGANGADSITLGLRAKAGERTITIGDRNAGASLGSVYVGQGDIANPKLDNGGWATSIGYNSDATGYGSIALGSNAVAKNFYAKDSKGNSLELNKPYDDNGVTKFRFNSKPDIQRASVAIGYGASADNGNIAIGSYSDASTDLHGKEINSYLTNKKADSYVSVGKSDALRRISNVADGAANSDVATIAQLKEAVKETDASKKANIDASNIGKHLKFKADGKTAADSSDITTNEDAWGEAIGTGKVQENNGQLVTGGTVYSALENQKKDLSVHAGWGISVAKDKDGKAISLNRNLGRDAYTKDKAVLKADENKSALVIGGRVNPGDATGGQTAEKDYGALGQDSVTVGGADNTVRENGDAAVVVGGVSNTASAQYSTVIGGSANDALGNQSSVFGGHDNDAHGTYSTASGGSMNRAYGAAASVFGGGVNSALGDSSVAVGGLQSTVNGTFAVGIAGGSTNADYALAAGNGANVTVENGTAIGYQATTDEAGTIAFGHDAGDAYYSSTTWPQKATKQNGKYYDANNKEISKAKYDALKNSDGTWNDYSKTPTVVEKTYDKAAYNRLVKVADGKDDHDVVVMEQLTKAKNDLTKDLSVNAGWGINIADEKDPKIGEVTKKNVISLNRNLGTNYGNKYGNGKVTFEADGENSLIIGGGAINDSLGESDKDFTFGAHAKDSVLVGGMNNDIDKNSERALIVGGTNNKTLSTNKVQQTGTDAIIVGGTDNKAEGDGAVLIGGNRNEASGLYSMTVGGTVNKNEGWLSSIFGGTRNNILKSDKSDPTGAAIFGGTDNTIEGEGIAATIFGGEKNVADNLLAVVVGGEANHSSGNASTVLGGNYNLANGTVSTAIGGQVNNAIGNGSVVVGGGRNLTSGTYSYASGGLYNNVTGTGASSLGGESSSVNGMFSTGVAGGSTGQDAFFSLAAGYQAVVADGGVEKTYLDENNPNDIKEMEKVEEAIQNGNMHSLPGYYMEDPESSLGNAKFIHYDKFSTALGYQATANEPGTIAFGHDAGDESGYTYEWETLTDEKGNPKQNEIDGTTNDYTKAPKSIKKNEPYTSAYYNRLVKVADGIDDHDVVVMEQLKQYVEKDASNLGNNIEVYKTDKNGNVQLDENKKPVKDTGATTTAQKNSKDDWGKALGAGTLTAATAKDSDQLVTGKTLYDYDKPTGSTNYVNANNTTGQNLSALDAQVKSNAKTLNDKTHNIKYYSVTKGFKIGDYRTNENNDGATDAALAGMAAGYETGTTGIASTVAGSYSGVIGSDLQGAAAVSVGTVNVNKNTNPNKAFSGVANSIVGQANMTTDSNAAIIVGAGNSVTNSYRDLDTTTDTLSNIKRAVASKDANALKKALQDAVPKSGGQVMVMGGGNNVESAYMSQVVGVGNTVKGNQVESKGEWVTDTSNTAIKYDPEKSSQYNYVDGFSNEVINGKHDYIIGANNKLSGDSYDDKEAKKYSNESNIVFGDNHTLTNTKNAVIIGSSDTQMILDKGDNATAIGHNASAQRDALAVGVNTEAGGNAVALGTSTIAHNNSIAIGTKATAVSSQNLAIGWEAHIGNIKTDNEKIKNAVALGSDSQVKVNDLLESDNNRGVLSIGDKDKERRIIHVRAGVNDTDAVNVSQLESVQSDLTGKGLKFAANSGNEYTAKLGTTVKVLGTAKKEGHEYTADNLTTEIDKDGNITILMDKNVSAEKIAVNGKDGENGKPGTAGSIGISGQDGKAGVGIDGKDGISIKGQNGKDGVTIKGIDGVDGVDGAEGHIGLNGKDGMTDIFTTAGTPGLDGKDGETMTRIVYKDPKGTEHEAATLDDGLKFKGDDGKEIAKKLNNTLDIIGGAKGDLTEGNIGVNSTDKGQLKVQLAKDLKGITSISNQKTEGGKTTGAKITLGDDGSVNVNGGKITNVGSGADASGKYTETTNAANIGDVQKIAENTATGLTGKGLKFAANSGDEYTAKLGSTVKIQGTAKKAGHEYTADNLTTEIDKDGNITILMDKNVSAEKIAVNGKDGENGKPGTAGSIGISGQDGKAGVGIDGKDGISIKGQNGKDGVTIKGIDGVDGVDGAEGHIGLNGKDGMTDIFTTAGTPGLDGKDGETMTRIVYKDPKGTEHEAATLDDGLKFKGDDGKEIAKKLNNTLDIIGGAKGDLTEGNIGVNSTDKGQLKVQLAKDLKGITSISNQKTEGGKTTGAKVTLGADGSVDVNGGKITHVGSGADASGNYTTTTNAANIGDVQKIVKDAVDSAADTTNKALAGKANVDASNIGANLKGEDGKAASAEAQKANAEKWGSAIGTGEIKADDGRMVTGKTVYDEVRPKVDGSYVKKDKTTGENLSALDSKIGSMDKDGNYIKKDDSISENLSTLDTQVKKNADDITNINQSISTLDQNAVKYDDSNKSKVTLAGKEGTTITNVKDGALSEKSSDAVNGKQLYNEQKAREEADKAITERVTNNTNEITKIKNGDFTDASKTAIHNIAKDAVKVVNGTNTTVTTVDGTNTTPTTYAVNVEGNGKVDSGDKGLISGGTLYNEVRPTEDGNYVKKDKTTGQNLSALDSGLKATSDLIHTNTQQIYRDMNNAYGRLNNNINKAAAGSNALAALHPLDYDPDDKADFAVGYGHYRNANAAAVGAFYHPNENTMVNVGVSLGNGDPGFNAGVSFKVGRGGAGREAMSKTEMAKVINSQSKEIDALKKDNADKDKRIDALEQKMAEILAKLDKNGK